jgi:hypothetical protein
VTLKWKREQPISQRPPSLSLAKPKRLQLKLLPPKISTKEHAEAKSALDMSWRKAHLADVIGARSVILITSSLVSLLNSSVNPEKIVMLIPYLKFCAGVR